MLTDDRLYCIGWGGVVPLARLLLGSLCTRHLERRSGEWLLNEFRKSQWQRVI
jgi:hypothetical protein